MSCFAYKLTIVSLIAFGWASAARATTRYVENTTGCCLRTAPGCTGVEGTAPFCTIEDAVADLDTVDGDLILVAADDTYAPSGGRLDVSKVITIVSDGSGQALERAATTTINATVNFQFGDQDAVGRRIEGFTITSPGTSGNNDGIRVSARIVDIIGNIIENNADRGVDVSGAAGKLVTFRGNIIRGNQNSGVNIDTSPAAFLTITKLSITVADMMVGESVSPVPIWLSLQTRRFVETTPIMMVAGSTLGALTLSGL